MLTRLILHILRMMLMMLMMGVATAGDVASAISEVSVSASIPIYHDEQPAHTSTAEQHHSCVISSTEDCSIASMAVGQSNLVYPGSKTRCMFSDSTDYAFQVIPGDTGRLLFFFEGGGCREN
jgi:hypothetical protein